MRSSNNLEYSDIFSDKALIQMIICGFIYVYSFDNVPNEIISKVIKLIKRNNFFGYPENPNYLYDYIKALKEMGLEVDLIERIVDCSSDVVENVLGVSKTRIREKLD